jgi:uncharacterized protein (TIGR02268 family)
VLTLSSAALLRLVLLAAPAAPGVHAPAPTCEEDTRHLELTVDTARKTHQVCIRPGRTTSFLFNAKLARVEVAGRERFRMIEDETGFTLAPTWSLPDGEHVPVTVHFQDSAAPTSVTFSLVVHPSEVTRQVEVTRQPHTLASCLESEQRALEELQQCRREKARLEEESSGKVGLLGLLVHDLMGEGGVEDKDITKTVTSRPGNTLTSGKERSYRSDTGRVEGGHKVVRLAMEQELWNGGSTPWTPAGAVLVGPGDVELKALGVWPLEPIAPGKKHRVVLEVEATEEAARGTFTLKLWSQEGSTREEFFDGVTFPRSQRPRDCTAGGA